MIEIDPTGAIYGDVFRLNKQKNKLMVTQLHYDKTINDVNQPNFIIVCSGQSNSQGAESVYEQNEERDQPHSRIFGWNPSSLVWETADLRNESLGAQWYKPLGSNHFAFHFAKQLVEAYSDIRPGIINFGYGGMPICRWAKYEGSDTWFNYNNSILQYSAKILNMNQRAGDIYDMHVHLIYLALMNSQKQTVDCILWHQGESDGQIGVDDTYFYDSLHKVKDQYRSLPFCNSRTPFVAGTTTGSYHYLNLGWESKNKQILNLNHDADNYSLSVDVRDFYDSSIYGGHPVHFSSESQRKMGKLMFLKYRSMHDTW